jgi:alanyl-tRNA synthetase
MIPSSTIRQQFLDFFTQKCGHVFIPSSPVVPHDDPTLLFANAGMNQFKPYFLGTEKPKNVRVVNTQKCIRAGGKHNDLDDVGKDTYHHTFFEMLGNWSFGDYFKKEAITWAWELLTVVWKLDPTRLHVTVFEGDEAAGIPRDDEAADIWKSVGVLDGHIHLGNKKDNFWEMGATGPCGPCTEIHYDKTPDKSGAKLVNGGSDQCIEIWNNVFIQFNRNEDQSLTPLPAKHVDTGMGFERICAVLNGANSNYDTDVFAPIFAAITDVTKSRPYGGVLDDLIDTAYRVIADHIRMMTFAISDGIVGSQATVVPGSNKRPAVLRSVIRRASRYGYQVLGLKEPFLYKLSGVVVEQLGGVFPELKKNPEKVREIIYSEEVGFLKTLERGLKMFSDLTRTMHFQAISDSYTKRNPELENLRKFFGLPLTSPLPPYPAHVDFVSMENLGKSELKVFVPDNAESLRNFIEQHNIVVPPLSGHAAFQLHSTYGLDIGITQQMASEAQMTVDMDDYERRWKEFQRISNAGAKNIVISAVQGTLPKTDDTPKYDNAIITVKVLGWVKDNAVITAGTLQPGDAVGLLLDRTNFYAEQGGQVGDTGMIDNPETDGIEFRVDNTIRLGDTVLHLGVQMSGSLSVGDTVQLTQTTSRRIDIMRNHTATHLLNLALRTVLGNHVEQKGSLVDDEKTRFDFSQDKPVSKEEERLIERRVNDLISRDLPVMATVMPLDEAKKLPGVRAMFGEKYPDPVRVVSIGADELVHLTHDDSVEFCGGTHVPRTGTIGYFKIQSQEPVAKGVRRLTAVTGRMASEALATMTTTLDDVSSKFQCKPEEVVGRIDSLQAEVKAIQVQYSKLLNTQLTAELDRLLAEAPVQNGTMVLVAKLSVGTNDLVRAQIDRIKQKSTSAYITLVWDEGDKVPVLVALTPDLVKKGLKAGDIAKQVAGVLGGSGGGKPDMAQAGGKDASKIPEALAKAQELAKV